MMTKKSKLPKHLEPKKKHIDTDEAMRYSRQIMLKDFDIEGQEALLNSAVLIVGLGGLGCAAAQYLVASGVGSMTLIDDDKVENTNLQRQVLHGESSIGTLKVESAYHALRQLNSAVNISRINVRQDKDELLELAEQHDLILDCSDNLDTRNLLNEVAYASKTFLVSGAAIRMEGQVFCVSPTDKSACYACVSQFFGEQNLSCMESGVMSPVVGIIGAMQALEGIKALTAFGELALNKLQVFDAHCSTWQSFTVNACADCKVCAKS